jgi:hypothetical protein
LTTEVGEYKQKLADKTQQLADTIRDKDEIIADLRRKVMGAEATVKGWGPALSGLIQQLTVCYS